MRQLEPQAWYYDYFEKDHLGNIRIVLTEQSDFSMYLASMEQESAAKETALFSNVESSRSAKPAGYPEDNSATKANSFVAKLNATNPDKKIGPSLVIKVMAGDTIRIGARAFYKSQGPVQNKKVQPAEDMVTALAAAFGNGGSSTPGVHASRSSNNTPFTSDFYNNEYQHLKEKDPQENVTGRPKAYLNFVLFDEQFKLVEENSGVKQVKAEPDQLQTLAQDKTVIKQSGFLYIYTSNESPQDVFFDNVILEHITGPVLEETHYYPFGLVMDGISGKAVGKLENKRGYNGNELQNKEWNDGSGLELYDFNARTYDQQVGRFVQIDPMTDEGGQETLSTYHFSYNNPVRYSDPDGKCPNCATAGIGAVVGGLLGGGIELGRQIWNDGAVSNWSAVGGSALQGAVTGAAAGFTGGTSLLATAAASGAVNIAGGAANRGIQGKATTVNDVVIDGTVGAVFGGAGNVVGKVVSNTTNNLSKAAKGKLGEAITEIKYGMMGYISLGKAEVLTGAKTATGRDQVAKYDHLMESMFTGKLLTVESKFNGSGFTSNQTAAQGNVLTPGGLIVDRTTSQGLGNSAQAAVTGAGAGGAASQKNKRP